MDDIYEAAYEKITTLQWLMKHYQIYFQSEMGLLSDVTRGQGRILAMLKIQPEIATKDLAYLLGIRQQSLNELLIKLEKSGYIERRPSENDKRVMIVCLTEKGRQTQQTKSNYEELFNCLSEEEITQFCAYLDKLIDSFRKATGRDKEDDFMENRMDAVKERMGTEQFEELMKMRERAFGFFGGGDGVRNIPGAERFSKDYNGPIPDRRGFRFPDIRKDI